MIIRKLVSHALALLIVLGCCSCSSSSQTDKTSTSTKGTTDSKNKPTITVQYFVGRADIQKALRAFQSNNPEVTVKSESYENDIKTVNAFSNKLLLDLNTGEGPDVMIYEPNLFKSLYKAVGSGAFYDINNLIEADKESNLADCYSNIIDCGIIDGARYYVPLRAYIGSFYTTEGILKKNNISIDYKHWTWKDMLQIYEQFSRNNNKAAKYLVNYEISFSDMLSGFGKSFVDYKNKKSNFNNKEVIEALRVYKKLYKCAPEYDQGISDITLDLVKGLKSNYFVFYQTFYMYNQSTILTVDKNYRDNMNERLLVIPFPSWYGDGYQNAEPIYLYSISNRCKNKEYAYKLLKMLLSEETQSLKDYDHNKNSFNYDMGYAVNKKALLKNLNSMGTEMSEKINFDYKALPTETIDNYKFIIESSSSKIYYDAHIKTILMSALDNCLQGKLSEEEALKRADNKIELFLNE